MDTEVAAVRSDTLTYEEVYRAATTAGGFPALETRFLATFEADDGVFGSEGRFLVVKSDDTAYAVLGLVIILNGQLNGLRGATWESLNSFQPMGPEPQVIDYVNTSLDFSLRYPSDWTVDESFPGEVSFQGAGQDEEAAVAVRILEDAAATTLDNLMDVEVAEARSGSLSYEEVYRAATTVGGYPALETRFLATLEVDVGVVGSEGRFLVVKADDTAYAVLGIVIILNGQLNGLRGATWEALNSFQPLGPEPPGRLGPELGPEDYYNLGVDHYNRGDLQAALAAYDTSIQLDPQQALVHYGRGLVYYVLSDLEAALVDYDRAIELDSGYGPAYYGRALIRDGRGDTASAIADYGQFLLLYTVQDSFSFGTIGYAQARVEELERVVIPALTLAVEQAAGLSGTTVTVVVGGPAVNTAVSLVVASGSPETKGFEVEPAGTQIALADPQGVATFTFTVVAPAGRLVTLTASALTGGGAETVTGTFEITAEAPPPVSVLDAGAYIRLGNDHYNRGELEAALAAYTSALDQSPDNATAAISYHNSGLVYYAQGELRKGLAQLDAAIALDPVYATAYYYRAVTLDGLGSMQEAIADYGRFLELQTTEDEFSSYARSRLNELEQLPSLDANAYISRGVASYDLGDFEAALADLDQAVALNPEYAAAYYYRSLIWNSLGNPVDAVADFEGFLELSTPEQEFADHTVVSLEELAEAEKTFTISRWTRISIPRLSTPTSCVVDPADGGDCVKLSTVLAPGVLVHCKKKGTITVTITYSDGTDKTTKTVTVDCD